MMDLTFPSNLCTAIRFVETGGHPDPPNAIGAAGELGPLQITWSCWFDAVEHVPSIGGVYRDCQRLEYAEKIFVAYLDRYTLHGDTTETLARIWNGGPDGQNKQEATQPYWDKVSKALGVARDCQKDWGYGGPANQ